MKIPFKYFLFLVLISIWACKKNKEYSSGKLVLPEEEPVISKPGTPIPAFYEGYDLICIHPDPSKSTKALRVQVKSRYQSDCDRAFPVKEKTFSSFDYLIIAFLNIGYFYRKSIPDNPLIEPEFYTLPNQFIREHHHISESGWEKVKTKNLDLNQFKNEKGFELIAQDLNILPVNTNK